MLAVQATIFLATTAFVTLATAQDCSSKRDSGESCGAEGSGRMFYFDTRMSVCQPFFFKGCGGNDNRYASLQACREACAGTQKTNAQIRNGNQWVLAEKCGASHLIPNGKYLECGTTACPNGHECRSGVCCPTREHVCGMRDDSGSFVNGIDDKPRFAWSEEIQSCWRFSYYGANGNYNNFPNFQSCIAFCSNKH